MNDWAPTSWSFWLVVSWSVLWLGLLARKCRVSSTRVTVFGLFVLQGFVASELALVGYELLESQPWLRDRFPGLGGADNSLAGFVVGVGLLEEGLKWAAFVVLWGALPNLRRSLDVLGAAAAIGIGFAAGENLMGAQVLPESELLVRAFTAPFVHLVFGAFWAYGWAKVVRRDPHAWFWSIASLGAAALLHGVYDYFTLRQGFALATAPLLGFAWWAVSRYIESEAAGRSGGSELQAISYRQHRSGRV